MKQLSAILLLLGVFFSALPATTVFADENAKFVFAPAPITDPVQPGENAGRGTFTYIALDGTPEFTLLGFNLTKRKGAGHGQPGSSVTGGLLIGSDEDETTDLFGLNFGVNFEGGNRMSIPFFGLTMGLVSVTSDFADVLITNYGLQGGFQHHMELSPNVYLTPYITYGWQAFFGTIFPDSGSSMDFDGSTTMLTLGFDVSFSGISLATLASMGEEDMTMLQVGFNF